MGSCISRPITKEHSIHHPSAAGDGHPKLQDFIPVVVPHSGSTDESFFDAQPWLESDYDDDFYSIDGDYSPSHGDTPVHRRFSTGTPLVLTQPHGNTGSPRLVKANSTPSCTGTPPHVNLAAGTLHSNEVVADKELAGYTPEIPPGDKKKRLSELFRLSRGGFAYENVLNVNTSADAKIVSGSDLTSVYSSPFISTTTSVCRSERTSNASIKSHRNKALKSVHPVGCLTKLLTVRHKNEKRMDAETIFEQGHKSGGNTVEKV